MADSQQRRDRAGADGALAVALARGAAARGVLCVAAISFACNLGALAVPLFNMQVFNRVLTTRDPATLATLVTGLAVCLLCYGVLDFLRGLALEAVAARLAGRLSLPLLRAVASGRRGAGAAAEAMADLETVRQFVAGSACVAPFELLWLPVLLLALLVQHWGYAAAAVLFCALLGALNVLGDLLSRRAMLAANEAATKGLRRVASAVGAADAVVALGMLPTLSRRWQDAQRRATGLAHRAVLRSRGVAALTGALRMAMTGAMVALGLVLALNGLASGGSMVAANMILARMLLPFHGVAATRRQWVGALAAWGRLRRALEAPVPMRYAHALPAPEGRLSVERLVFVPPGGDRPLLRGVSFAVEPGELVGVIGPSSAGKSTLLRLLAGMLEPTAGGAYLDGTSTFLWEREDFARHVGFLPQGLALVDESVADNIARLRSPDMPAVLDAARRAGAHRIVAALPHGYATRIAGGTLSAGQRQRVALARALYGRPRVLLLDEPTALLDERGEADAIRLLRDLRDQGTTVLVASHRPALLGGADRLLLLRDGAVERFGPREEVLRAVAAPGVRLLRPAPRREAAS